MVYKSVKEWEKKIEKENIFIQDIIDNLRINLGNLPDGRPVYVSDRDYQTLIGDPVIQEIVQEKCGLTSLEEALYGGKISTEMQKELLEEIVEKYKGTGIFHFSQIDKVPKTPSLIYQ